MKRKLISTISCLLFLCTLATAQEPPSQSATVTSAGATISDFKGKVSLQLPGQALMSPSRGQVLPPETTVNTDDGRLLLKLSDGSEVLVRPHTRVVIKEPDNSAWRYLQLLLGRIRTQVQKHLGGTPSFQIGTPSAVISVRGTQFDVEVDRRGFTEVDVHEGVVELESFNGRGESVMIRAGFSSRVSMDSAPETPRPTHDLRPILDRPTQKGRHDSRDDDPIRRLEAADHGGDHGGSGSSGVDGGSGSGSEGGSSGSDGGSTSGSSGSSGSDGGSSSSDGGSTSGSGGSSGSDGGSSSTSGSSGSDGGSRTSGSGDRSGSSDGGTSGTSGSGSGDRSGSGDHHGGRPPG